MQTKLTLFLALLITAAATGQPGSLDPAFGDGGKLHFKLAPSSDYLNDVAILQNGKIIAVGEMKTGAFASSPILARFEANGLPDMGFGDGGTLLLEDLIRANAILEQADGKILIAGSWGLTTFDASFRLLRLLPDGSPDISFGMDGVAVAPMLESSEATAVALLPDEKIAVAGFAKDNGNDAFLAARFLPDGTADSSFGTGGTAIAGFNGASKAYGLAIQPDGKIVAAGTSSIFMAVARFDVDGSLDASFSGDGMMTTSQARGTGESVAIQSDGKILVGGYWNLGGVMETRLVRYLTDGTLDPDFNPEVLSTAPFEQIYKNDMLLQPDGNILLSFYTGMDGESDLLLLRYLPDGSLDPFFGSAGAVTIDYSTVYERGTALALHSDGRILMGGISNFDFVLAQIDASGNPDPTFTGGRFNLGTADNFPSTFAVQPDGKILVGGINASVDFGRSFLLGRLHPDGAVDTSFGSDGLATSGNETSLGELQKILVQPDGKILATGPRAPVFEVARLLPDGATDLSFGINGVRGMAFSANSSDSHCETMALQNDGKILLAGRSAENNQYDFAIGRLNADGSADLSFGASGGTTTPFPGISSQINALAIQPDGRIVAGGYEGGITSPQFALARYLPGGTLDPGFGMGGATSLLIGSRCQINNLALQPDGKILAIGNATIGGVNKMILLRLLPNGSPDPDFGQNGWAAGTFGLAAATGMGLAYLPGDSSILVCGAGESAYFCLARFKADGTLDTGFGDQGYMLTNFGTPVFRGPRALEVLPGGKVLLAGDAGEGNDFALARYLLGLNVGTLDFSSISATAFIFPNPVAGEATLQFTLPEPATLTIALQDLHGRQVAVFADQEHWPAGEHRQLLNFGQGLAAGSYCLRITDGSKQVLIKIIKN